MAKPTTEIVKAQIDTHEAICAERWGETLWRLKRLERGMIAATFGIVGFLVAIIFLLLEG